MSWTLISATQSSTVRQNPFSLDTTATFGEKTELMKRDKCTQSWQEVQWFQISGRVKGTQNIRTTSYISSPYSSKCSYKANFTRGYWRNYILYSSLDLKELCRKLHNKSVHQITWTNFGKFSIKEALRIVADCNIDLHSVILTSIWHPCVINNFAECHNDHKMMYIVTWESVTLNTRFHGRRNLEASPNTNVDTYTNFWNACSHLTKVYQIHKECKWSIYGASTWSLKPQFMQELNVASISS